MQEQCFSSVETILSLLLHCNLTIVTFVTLFLVGLLIQIQLNLVNGLCIPSRNYSCACIAITIMILPFLFTVCTHLNCGPQVAGASAKGEEIPGDGLHK